MPRRPDMRSEWIDAATGDNDAARERDARPIFSVLSTNWTD